LTIARAVRIFKTKVAYVIEWVENLETVPKNEWDTLALALDTPLFEWEWLRQFEASGSMTPETGWLPCHLTVRSDGRLVAAAPLYVKGHSQGEFVWDYMWADVANQLKTEYYPKLIGMSPATPSVGYRFLIDPGEDENAMTRIILQAIDHFCEENNLSGCSFLFVDDGWKQRIISHGYVAWLHQSYEWQNQEFTSFDDYLESFTKNQRRNIKRERENVRKQGIEIRAFTGKDIPQRFFPMVYDYYKKTNDQFGPWAAKFLNRSFFEGLYPDFTNRLLIMAAFENGASKPMGMSFLLNKGKSIIGRYWGASYWADSLHFDACYYAPIEWAIQKGIQRFDPGAGSPHKLRRGFFAVANHSLHKFRDPVMQNIMETYIDELNRGETDRIRMMNRSLPLKEPYLPDFSNFKR